MCAELIDGSWFCAECAAEERRIAEAHGYRRFAADIARESDHRGEIRELETTKA
jgi:hypothetical protein